MKRYRNGDGTCGRGAVLLGTVLIGPIVLSAMAVQDTKPNPRDNAFQKLMLDAHNRERRREKKSELQIAPLLIEAARIQALDMAQSQSMSHHGTDGSTPEERVRRVGYKYQNTAENVAAGHTSIAQVMKDWMGSEGHRANILGDYTELGSARVVGEGGIRYWVVVFGTPRTLGAPADADKQFHAEMNKLRREATLESVAYSYVLARIAESVARALGEGDRSMLEQHGAPVYSRMRTAGFDPTKSRFTVAEGHSKPQDVVRGLMASEGGKTTILGDYEQLGVGVATDAEGTAHWVILYGTRAAGQRDIEP